MIFAAYFEGFTFASNHLRKGKGHPISKLFFSYFLSSVLFNKNSRKWQSAEEQVSVSSHVVFPGQNKHTGWLQAADIGKLIIASNLIITAAPIIFHSSSLL